MKRRTVYIVVAIAVALAAMLVATTSLAKRPPLTQEAVAWDLANVEVVDAGQVITLDEGVMTKGYTLVARARSTGGNVVPEGQLVLKLDAFSPFADMPGQQAGLWYIRGDWSITRKNAPPESANARHSPDVVKGKIQAELGFNPAEEAGNWSALATLPMSTAAGRWGRGQGTFSLDGQGAGALILDATLWPASR
jgi:hypothetical protein